VSTEGSPGEELLSKDYIVTIRKGVLKHKFNVTDLHLIMPKTGIYVGFEKLILDRNKVERVVTDSNSNSTTIQKHTILLYCIILLKRTLSILFLAANGLNKTNKM